MEPLVSVAVITYNSSQYVLETLESAKQQTYQNIELIISDDCSTDNTVEICSDWLERNASRFVRIDLISSDKNTGIPANCNRCLKATKGEWVKFIAGDDMLSKDCISLNISYINHGNSDISIVLSNVILFKNESKNLINGIVQTPDNKDTLREDSNAKIQYLALLNKYFGNSPGLFVSRKVLVEVGYDERFHYLEDYPFALNATKIGYRFYYLKMVTAYYRISDKSVCLFQTDSILYNDFYLKRRAFDLAYIYPNVSWFKRLLMDYEYKRKYIINKVGLNRNNIICKVIYRLTSV